MLVLTLVLYRELDQGWLKFLLLFFVPDLALLAYLSSPRLGAVAYNMMHTYALPAMLFALGFVTERGMPMGAALIWAAHIGMDRLLGLGLKYPETFRPTHLQRL